MSKQTEIRPEINRVLDELASGMVNRGEAPSDVVAKFWLLDELERAVPGAAAATAKRAQEAGHTWPQIAAGTPTNSETLSRRVADRLDRLAADDAKAEDDYSAGYPIGKAAEITHRARSAIDNLRKKDRARMAAGEAVPVWFNEDGLIVDLEYVRAHIKTRVRGARVER
jgi:hypothetical protein